MTAKRNTLLLVVIPFAVLLLAAGALFPFALQWIESRSRAASRAGKYSEATEPVEGEYEWAGPAGEHHKTLQFIFDNPAIMDPELQPAGDARLEDYRPIIGVVVGGQAYAFAQDAMVGEHRHIVNFVAEDTPYAVTFCDMAKCARVFTHDDDIDLRAGGMDIDNQLVLLHDGVRYGQTSQAIPLKDVEFDITTFGVWKKRHPDTKVFAGDLYR